MKERGVQMGVGRRSTYFEKIDVPGQTKSLPFRLSFHGRGTVDLLRTKRCSVRLLRRY